MTDNTQEIEWLRGYSLLREIVHKWDSPELSLTEGTYKHDAIYDLSIKYRNAETFPEILSEGINPFFRADLKYHKESRVEMLMKFLSDTHRYYVPSSVSTPLELNMTIGYQLGYGTCGLRSLSHALHDLSIPHRLLGKAYFAGNRVINSICSRSLLRVYIDELVMDNPNSIPPEAEEKFEIVQKVTMEALSFKRYATNVGIDMIKKLMANRCLDIYCSERELDSETQLKYLKTLSRYTGDIHLLFEPIVGYYLENHSLETRRGGIDLISLRRDEELIAMGINECQQIIKDLAKPSQN